MVVLKYVRARVKIISFLKEKICSKWRQITRAGPPNMNIYDQQKNSDKVGRVAPEGVIIPLTLSKCMHKAYRPINVWSRGLPSEQVQH